MILSLLLALATAPADKGADQVRALILEGAKAPGASRQLTDFQVWRRGRNGWEFVRGVHYPVPKPS